MVLLSNNVEDVIRSFRWIYVRFMIKKRCLRNLNIFVESIFSDIYFMLDI